MKKLLVFIVIIIALFFFKDYLNPYWVKFFSYTEEEESMGWLSKQSDDLYRGLPDMDFDTAITSLKDFESSINNSIANLNQVNKETRQKYKHTLICELAVVYKKLAMFYVSKGEDDLYMQYTKKSQDKLAECTDLKSTIIQ